MKYYTVKIYDIRISHTRITQINDLKVHHLFKIVLIKKNKNNEH